MAATLPAINIGGSKVGHPVHAENVPTPPPQNKRNTLGSGRVYVVTKKRTQSKRDRELEERQAKLRAEQPSLTKKDTSAYVFGRMSVVVD